MTRQHSSFACTECGTAAPRWAGRCAGCGAWNTLVEEKAPPVSSASRTGPAARPMPLARAGGAGWAARPTGLAEVDRVLGGGLVPGSVTLLGGEPGVGKSTLLLQVLARLAGEGRRCLLVAAEESPQQVRLRAERLETIAEELWVVASTDVEEVVAAVEELRPEVLVVDSIQAVSDPATSGPPGSVAQVRAAATRLARLAKEGDVTTVLVGHVTKDGALAGPRALEHLVDTVLAFGGDRHHALRLLRAPKHRFGPTTELGLFEMTEGGLAAVADAGHLFLSDRREGLAGSVVVPTVDGRRPLLVELQALVTPGPPAGSGIPPRRSSQGLDGGRMAMVLAILDKRAGVRLGPYDVYTVAVGGARVTDPGADLPLALVLASAAAGTPLPEHLVACAELGLGGELRQVPNLAHRLGEAARLGFRAAIVPPSAPDTPETMTAMRAATLSEAMLLAGLDPGRMQRLHPPLAS
ncbi:MAG TPA: DNA repair protein RadA [Acidimicrobiales bacterium]